MPRLGVLARVALASALVVSLEGLGASCAFAHGGRPVFKGPRPPADPTPPPPPPPPPSPGRSPNTSPPPAGNQPTPQPPESTPTGGDGGVDGTGGGGPRRTAAAGADAWTYWWELEKEAFLSLKASLYRTRRTADHPLAALGEARAPTSDATRPTEKEVDTVVLPALLRSVGPGADADVEGASWLALAKLTRDPAVARRIREVALDPSEPALVREPAVLALGALRRATPVFEARELDRLRQACLSIVEDDASTTRVRAFAALSLGLLGDQPGLPVGERLFELVRRPWPSSEIPVALVVALSLQRPDTIAPATVDALVVCAGRGRLVRESAATTLRAHAAVAVGRLGSEEHVAPLANALATRGVPPEVRQSAAIALGLLGRRVGAAARAEVESALVRAADGSGDPVVRAYAILSLARLLEADVAAGRTSSLDPASSPAAREVLRAAEKGAAVLRPFGALALGRVGRAVGDLPDAAVAGRFRGRAVEVLRSGLDDSALDTRSRAAFAVGLGLLADEGAVSRLVAIVSDVGESPELRGYAAVALGLVGDPEATVVRAVRGALRERSSDELRAQAAVALALLCGGDAVDSLLEELRDADVRHVVGEVLVVLGRVGDARAIPALLGILEDATRGENLRARAAAGLGLVGDLEAVPSLSAFGRDLNHRVVTDALAEVLRIL
jgi:HEAT repeat protein